jgi:hypothetical protein
MDLLRFTCLCGHYEGGRLRCVEHLKWPFMVYVVVLLSDELTKVNNE